MPSDLDRSRGRGWLGSFTRSHDRSGRRPGWVGPLVLLAVLCLALVFGSGVFSSGTPSAEQRARALETQIRCPSCVDVSVASSSAATAASLRQQILHWVREGQSDQQIENTLVARYGMSILLQPPASGLSVVVWVVPAVAGAAALVGIGSLFWRRSRAMRAITDKPQKPGIAVDGSTAPSGSGGTSGEASQELVTK